MRDNIACVVSLHPASPAGRAVFGKHPAVYRLREMNRYDESTDSLETSGAQKGSLESFPRISRLADGSAG
jgi:hypothetical protein